MAVRVAVDPSEDLDQIISKIKSQSSKDVTLVLPNETRALQELNNFYALRTAARDSGVNLSFSGGNKTIRGLAKLLGFTIDKDGEGPEAAPIGNTPTANPRSNTTNTFPGVPDGFIAASPSTGNGFEGAPPPQRTDPRAFFEQINSFETPGIPNTRIQPPPMRGNNGSGLAQPGDEMLSPENVPDFFGSADGGEQRTSRRPAQPQPEIDLGVGEGGNTMSLEEAMRSGLLGNTPTSNSFTPPSYLDEPAGMDMEDEVPSIPDEDNLASNMRQSRPRGVRDTDTNPGRPPRNNTKRTPKTPRPGRPNRGTAVVAGAGTGLLASPVIQRINKFINPVKATDNGIRMTAPTLTADELLARDKQRQRTNRIVYGSILLLLAIVAALVWLFVLPHNNGTDNNVPAPIALTVPVKTQPVNNTVRLALQTGDVNGYTSANPGTGAAGATTAAGTSGAATTAAAANNSANVDAAVTTVAGAGAGPATTAAATTGAASTNKLVVQTVNTGEIKKSGDGAATGQRTVADKPAGGSVSFFNGGNAAVGYGAGATIYSANGVNYKLVQGVTVPAGNPISGATGKANGQVVADKPGAVGNTDKPITRYLSTAVGIQLSAMQGGTDRVEKFVTQQDLDALKQQLQNQAAQEANSALKYDQNTQGVMVLKANNPTCAFRKNPGEAVDETGKFQGTCSTTLEAVIYNKAQLTDAVKAQMVKDPAYKLDDGTKVDLTGEPKIEDANGQRYVVVQATGKEVATVDPVAFKSAIAGKTKQEVIQTILPGLFPQVDAGLFQASLDKLPDANLPTADRLDVQFVPDYQAAQTATPGGSPTDASSTPGGMPQGSNSLPKAPTPTAKP